MGGPIERLWVAARWPRKLTANHIWWLAESFEIEVTWIRDPSDAFSLPAEREVHIPHPSNGIRYLTALHEFGHILDRRAMKLFKSQRDFGEMMACEGYAWAWALEHVIPEARPLIGPKEYGDLCRGFFAHLLWPEDHVWPRLGV